MLNTKLKIKSVISILLLATCSQVQAQTETPDIGEPQYAVTDNNHVNLGNAGLYFHLPDVSIGQGQFALSHSISVNSNELANLSAYASGYKEKYMGGIRKHYQTLEPTSSRLFETIHVSDHESSADFIIDSNGKFESMGDKTLQLTVADNHHFVLTKTDGTRVYFYSSLEIPSSFSTGYWPYASMVKIEYTNGLIIDIHKDGHNITSPITSVNSNNGFQLKYVYDLHNRPLEASKQSATSNPNVTADSVNWSNNFPVKIIALNNAVETCPIAGRTCTPSGEWPTATYQWPDGMPRALYIGESVVSTTNSMGVTTEFQHTAFDTQEGNPYSGGEGEYFYPRITKVTNTQGIEISYEYANVWNATSYPPFLTFSSGDTGVLISAKKNGVTAHYNLRNGGTQYNSGYGTKVWTSGTYKGVNYVVRPANKFIAGARVSAPYLIDTWDKTIHLKEDFSNAVTQVENKLDGTTTNYDYDAFGRLKSVESDGVYKKITYPPAHSPGGFCDYYQYCHKPYKVTDFHWDGTTPNYTTYTYHRLSGNVESVTHPTSSNKTPKTVYSYQQYNARFLNSSGTMTTSSQPIWLLSSEFSCQNSNVSGQNCSSNDKVEIAYHYGSGSGSNNLFLQGKTVTSQADNKSLTYCYKYDKYGHQIEESSPKSGITDCNVGREY